jgi:malate dehydrogenase (quinone)
MIPSYGVSLSDNPELFEEIHASTAKALGLDDKNWSGVETKVLSEKA